MTLKFKNRIAFFNMFTAALITAFVFIVIYFVVSNTAYIHLDDDILTEKEEVFSNLDWHRDSIIINKMPEWEEAEHNQIEVNPTFLQILDTSGKVIFNSSNLLKGQFLFSQENNTVKTLPSVFFVCPVCGNTYDTTAPGRCGISMTSSEKFIKIIDLKS